MASYNEWVRRLGSSTFNYWFGYVANASWVVWLVSRGTALGPEPLSPMRFAAHAVGGLLLWTFLEYVLHRFVYHEWQSFLSHGHGLHHTAPRSLIGVPWYLTTLALWGVYQLLALALPPGPVGVEMGTCWLGYIGYCLVHHGTHHWPMRAPYLRTVKRLHHLHHAFPQHNWGVTSSLWDHVFGTYMDKKPSQRSARQRPRVAPPLLAWQDQAPRQ